MYRPGAPPGPENQIHVQARLKVKIPMRPGLGLVN